MIKTKEKNKLIEDLSRKYQFHEVVKNILYKLDEENGLKVFKNIEELAQRESWMSDIADCLEESFKEFEVDDPLELMYAFMDSWSETDYYYRKIYKPIKMEIKAYMKDLEDYCSTIDNPSWNAVTWLHQITFDLVDHFFWDPFIKHHKVYEAASDVYIKKTEGEEYFNQIQTVKEIVKEVNDFDELLSIFNGEKLHEDVFSFDFHKLKNWTINKKENKIDVYPVPF